MMTYRERYNKIVFNGYRIRAMLLGVPVNTEVRYRPDQKREENSGRFAKENGGKSSSKGLTSTPKNGTIRLDMYGVPFDYPTVQLPKAEYAHVCSEISTNYSMYRGKPYGKIDLGKKSYQFENRRFGDYNIYYVGKRR